MRGRIDKDNKYIYIYACRESKRDRERYRERERETLRNIYRDREREPEITHKLDRHYIYKSAKRERETFIKEKNP